MVIKEMCKTYSYSGIFQHILNSKKGLFWFFLSCVWSYMKSITREAVNNSSAQGNGWSIVQKSWNNSPPPPPPPLSLVRNVDFLITFYTQANRITQIHWDNQMNPEETYFILDEVFLFIENFCRNWVFAFSLSCPCTRKGTFIAISGPIPFSCIVIIIACIHILIETTKVLYDIKVRSLGRLLGGISGLVWWPGDWPFPLPSGLLLLGWGFAESGIWPYQYPLDFPFSKNYSG